MYPLYPTTQSKIDPRFDVVIPHRDDPIDRNINPHYTTYDQVFESEFPSRKFEPREIKGKGRGFSGTSHYFFFEGEEVADPESMEDSTFDMVKSVYDGSAFCPLEFALQLAQNPSRDEEFEEQVDYTYNRLKELDDILYDVKKDEVKRVFNGIHTNSFALDFHEGYAVFIACSLANHSCCENVGWHTVNDVMYWTALIDIPVGTEITLSYTFPSIGPKRKKYFEENYGFTCGCELCSTPLDRWRAFKCDCGGVVYPEKEGFICHTCNFISTETEIEEFIKEEEFIKTIDKTQRQKFYYNPVRKMHDNHLFLFKVMRKYVSMKSCANPLQIFENYLIPVARYQVHYSHGRLYAAILEQYGVALLKYAKIMADTFEYCKEKAIRVFREAYELRCELGMGKSGYAAAIFIEHVSLVDPHKLDAFIEYDEY
ncbi:SET domain-containing protein [Entamoeba marina]